MNLKHRLNSLKNLFRRPEPSELIHITESNPPILTKEAYDDACKYVWMVKIFDYFIANIRLLPVKMLRQLKHKLIDFDARAGVWKDSVPPCVGEE